MVERWDAIVVGGGPSGSMAARRLAAAGARTLVLEKAQHPRYKACGGGVPARTVRLLDMSIDSVIEDTVTAIEVSRFGERAFVKRSVEPWAYMVMRDRFDALLLDRAEASGAEVHQGEGVREIEIAQGYARVRSERTAYEARFVIAADGATGVSGRAAGLAQGMASSVAYEWEIDAPAWALARWRGTANIDVGYRPWGYGWVFPKAGRLSVGVVLPGGGKQIKAWGARYAERLGLGGATVSIAKGHPLRHRRGPTSIARGPLLLTGDAAGMADEFTAEGIAYAVRSGQLAADAVATALGSDGEAASRYEAAVNGEIQPELDAARAISRTYYWCLTTWPWLALLASNRIGYFWRAFYRVMQGESRYDEELARVPWLGLRARAPGLRSPARTLFGGQPARVLGGRD